MQAMLRPGATTKYGNLDRWDAIDKFIGDPFADVPQEPIVRLSGYSMGDTPPSVTNRFGSLEETIPCLQFEPAKHVDETRSAAEGIFAPLEGKEQCDAGESGRQ